MGFKELAIGFVIVVIVFCIVASSRNRSKENKEQAQRATKTRRPTDRQTTTSTSSRPCSSSNVVDDFETVSKYINSNDETITLHAGNGEDIVFIFIALINCYNKTYIILQPRELLEGMSDDDSIVFHVTLVNGELNYEIEMDEDVVDAVFDIYNKLYDSTYQ